MRKRTQIMLGIASVGAGVGVLASCNIMTFFDFLLWWMYLC